MNPSFIAILDFRYIQRIQLIFNGVLKSAIRLRAEQVGEWTLDRSPLTAASLYMFPFV